MTSNRDYYFTVVSDAGEEMESGDEDELITGARDFIKMREKIFKAGYVEGVTRAKDEIEVKFDPLTNKNVVAAFIELGKLMGMIEASIAVDFDDDEKLKYLFHKVQCYSNFLISFSSQDKSGSPEDLSTKLEEFLQEFKMLDQDAYSSLKTVSGTDEIMGCGSACGCIAANPGMGIDMSKLKF